MRNLTLSLLLITSLSISFISLNSCGSVARSGGKALQSLVVNFAKNVGRNSAKAFRLRGGTKTAVTKKGRLVPYNQMVKLNKVKIPSPKSIHVIRNGGKMEGTQVARSSVKDAEIDLLLYDATGTPIIYANRTQHSLVYSAANRSYQRKAIKLVDDILLDVKNGKVATDAELKSVINKTVNKQLGSVTSKNPVVMDVTTGNLTFNVEFNSGSQIVGSINIYNVVQKGVVIGAGGYYVAKKVYK